MPIDAKTIQIFLPDGEPRGIRIAHITTRIVQAVQVPRSRLERMLQREELDHIGVYFLVGEPDEKAKPVAYIGQTEDLRSRLKSHHLSKEFWTTALFLFSQTDSFTLAHIRYLEWHSIRQAMSANRYVLENGNNGAKPFITEPMEADVLDAFDNASVLLSTLGFPLFEPVAGTTNGTSSSLTYFCTGPDADASGRMVADGFVVLQNSLARTDITGATHKSVASRRQAMIGSGTLTPQGESLRFTEDTLFHSPSGAAMTVLGRPANGWSEWKTRDGRTLHEIERAQTLSTEASGSSAHDS